MNMPLRIAVADDEPDMREYFQRCLVRLGHQVVAVSSNGRDLVERCRAANPDLVITDIKMPEMDGIDAAIQIHRERPVPVILVSAYHDPALIARAESDHVMAYLVKPIQQADIEPVIALAMRRFRQFEVLRREAADLSQAIENRQMFERAQAILMKRGQLSEVESFCRLQELAGKYARKLVEITQMILIAEEAFRPGDSSK